MDITNYALNHKFAIAFAAGAIALSKTANIFSIQHKYNVINNYYDHGQTMAGCANLGLFVGYMNQHANNLNLKENIINKAFSDIDQINKALTSHIAEDLEFFSNVATHAAVATLFVDDNTIYNTLHDAYDSVKNLLGINQNEAEL